DRARQDLRRRRVGSVRQRSPGARRQPCAPGRRGGLGLMQVLRVGDIAEFIEEVLSDQPGLQDAWVEGEVADCKVSRQGHCYLTLKDERASLQAVAFRLTYSRIRFQIQP